MAWALANGYADELQIDRINGDGDYSPDNCRWVTPAVNTRNRGVTKLTEEKVAFIKAELSKGEPGTCVRLAGLMGVDKQAIYDIRRGRTWKDVEPYAEYANLAVG